MHKTPTTLPVSSAPATGDTPVVALLVADGHAEVLPEFDALVNG